MPIHRTFLGLERPVLLAAADYLLDRYTHGETADLSQVVVVLPAARAGRRLLEILVEVCETRGLLFQPPTIETIGAMPEQLYEAKHPFASELTQQFAWAKAFAETDEVRLSRVLAQPPAADDDTSWHELGAMLQSQHRELASDRLDFSTVAKQAKALPGFDEEARWEALADIQTRYLRSLDELGQWDRQTARLFAIDHRECQAHYDFVLIAVADMNRTMRAMLDLVASRVTVLVAAPAAWEDRFDNYGCLIPHSWQETAVPIDDQQVRRVDGPADQAYAVAEVLAQSPGKYQADEVTIGLTDEALAPQIARQLSEFGVATRFVNEKPLATTGPLLLLSALADYLEDKTFSAFAALVRHPDLYRFLQQNGCNHTLLTALDKLQTSRLPLNLSTDDAWVGQHAPMVALALSLLAPTLRRLNVPARPLGDWVEPIEAFLLLVYGQQRLLKHDANDRITLAACESLHTALAKLPEIPQAMMPTQAAPKTIRLLLNTIAQDPVPPPAADNAIEMLGWLELPLDDAPLLIITNFNDGFVPSSHGADLFLPNRLRNHLGLNDSDRLYARDAYAVSVMLAARQQVVFIVGRRDQERNPLSPSRLLFAAPEKIVAQRALRFFGELPPAGPKLLLGGAIAPLAESQLEVPLPELPSKPLEYLRVTDFRSYLACPYRFYLKRVLGLDSIADISEELDGGQFGDLLHGVLQAFGSDAAIRSLTSPSQLADWLATRLYETATEQLGSQRRPTVNVQIEQLRLRLQAFARWQAARTLAGWEIRNVEQKVEKPIQAGTHTMLVQGRIDRIDFHPERQEWMVFDYKSGDAGDSPQKTHQRSGEWIDLQLPLYRQLAQTVATIDSPPLVGYILLPKDASAVGDAVPQWGLDDWNSANEKIVHVITSICEQVYWPPNYDRPSFDEHLAAICQEHVAGRRLPTREGAL